MFSDLVKDIKASLYDRVSDPVLSSFVISWCIWNYKTILIIISSESVYQKFSLINTVVYPDLVHIALFPLIGPLTTTFIYLFLYPSFTLEVQKYWRSMQVRIINQKKKIEGGELIEKAKLEQLFSINEKLTKENAEKEKDLERLTAANTSLTNKHEQLTDKYENLNERHRVLNERLLELENKNRDNEYKENLAKNTSYEKEMKILRFLAATPKEYISVDSIRIRLNVSEADAMIILQNIRRFIDFRGENNDEVRINMQGLNFLKSSNALPVR